MFDATVLMN